MMLVPHSSPITKQELQLHAAQTTPATLPEQGEYSVKLRNPGSASTTQPRRAGRKRGRRRCRPRLLLDLKGKICTPELQDSLAKPEFEKHQKPII
jgi:hypothetical protein